MSKWKKRMSCGRTTFVHPFVTSHLFKRHIWAIQCNSTDYFMKKCISTVLWWLWSVHCERKPIMLYPVTLSAGLWSILHFNWISVRIYSLLTTFPDSQRTGLLNREPPVSRTIVSHLGSNIGFFYWILMRCESSAQPRIGYSQLKSKEDEGLGCCSLETFVRSSAF